MMLNTLLTILKVDAPAPKIHLEKDGDLCLDYNGKYNISIIKSGGDDTVTVAWAVSGQGHGTNLAEFIKLLEVIAKA